jgi:hypothetical protein
VVGQEQYGCAGDGGEPGGQVEESLQAVEVEDLGGGPAAEQIIQVMMPMTDSLVSGEVTYAAVGHAG